MKEKSLRATTTETAATFKSQGDIKKPGKIAARLVQRKTQQDMNEKIPRLVAIIDKLENEQSDSSAATREQNIEAEKIDYLE